MKITDFLLGMGVALIVLFIGYNITIQYFTHWTEFCNEKYGIDKWKVIEITGTEEAQKKYPLYIGQVWKCVEK